LAARHSRVRGARGTRTWYIGDCQSRTRWRRLTCCSWDHSSPGGPDRSYFYADDVSVTALAVGSFAGGVGSLLPSSSRPVWSLLDGERIVALGEFDVSPLVRLPSATAQSLAACPGAAYWSGSKGPICSPCRVTASSASFPRSTQSQAGMHGRTLPHPRRTYGRSPPRAPTSGSPMSMSGRVAIGRPRARPGKTSSTRGRRPRSRRRGRRLCRRRGGDRFRVEQGRR